MQRSNAVFCSPPACDSMASVIRVSTPSETQEDPMSDNTYKLVEIVGTSSQSLEDAVQNAIKRAHQSIRNMRWFEVIETRGRIDDDKVAQWQVTLKVGFTLED